ncbi:hypothetical protein HanRHA438_Chr03g0105431 [Helianthus annuus]|nr:hypothetical protein HanRHA438_Chr03g0105431 [Helianthus annuus]
MQPCQCPIHFVCFHICRSEPKNTHKVLFSLKRNEAISEEKVFLRVVELLYLVRI